MRKIVLACVALAMTAPAVAKELPELFNVAFKTRGECQSAFMQNRNYYRQNPDERHPNDQDLSSSEYNEADRMNWECTEGADGKWYFTHQ